MPADQIAAAAAAEREDADDDDGDDAGACEIWPDNWAALRLFLAVETQWRVQLGVGVVVHLGLDYAALEAAMRMSGVADPAAMFADLRAMERAALPILNGE